MKVNELFRKEQVQPQETGRRKGVGAYQQQAQQAPVRKDEDRVSISPLSRQLSQLSKILDEDEQTRQARVADIKARVENGEYEVNREDVARSLISYAADTEDIA